MPDDYQDQYPSVQAAKRAVERHLRDKEHVHAVAIAPNVVDGEQTDELAIVVYVDEKVPEEDLAVEDLVPPQINVAGRGQHIPTDVREREIPSPDDSALPMRWMAHRPLFGGIEIGPADTSSAGTLGAPVEGGNGTTYLLTNRHVVADDLSNVSTGDEVAQPTDDETVATVAEYSTMDQSSTNQADSALLELVDGVDVANHVATVGPLGPSESAIFGETYVASGRSSRGGTSEIRALDYSGSISYDAGSYDFEGLVVFDRVTEGGDSGAIWGRYDEDSGELRPVGLHFAGSDATNQSLAIPWSALEAEHGQLTPASTSATVTPTDTTSATEVIPYTLTTGDRAVLKCVASRYGTPTDLPEETLELYDGGTNDNGEPTGDVIATASIDDNWGDVAEIEFTGLEASLGTGAHTVTIWTTYTGATEYEIVVSDPVNHRLHGTVTDTGGTPIEGVSVAAWQE